MQPANEMAGHFEQTLVAIRLQHCAFDLFVHSGPVKNATIKPFTAQTIDRRSTFSVQWT
jgi:hypothetical protein